MEKAAYLKLRLKKSEQYITIYELAIDHERMRIALRGHRQNCLTAHKTLSSGKATMGKEH